MEQYPAEHPSGRQTLILAEAPTYWSFSSAVLSPQLKMQSTKWQFSQAVH